MNNLVPLDENNVYDQKISVITNFIEKSLMVGVQFYGLEALLDPGDLVFNAIPSPYSMVQGLALIESMEMNLMENAIKLGIRMIDDNLSGYSSMIKFL